MTENAKPDIPESALELRVIFSSNWIDKWTVPNPFVSILLAALKPTGVSLEDFSFRQEPKNVAENGLVVNVNKLRSVITIGLDRITFRLANPDWGMAQDLATVYQSTVDTCQSFVALPIKSHDYVLAFHVTPGSMDLAASGKALVDSSKIGDADFYGINVAKQDNTLSIEKSLRYQGGAFFRLTRSFASPITFQEIAVSIYSDEVSALELLGIQGLI